LVGNNQTKAIARVRKDHDVRRAEIVEAAIALIGARGYNAVTVQMLAAGCGLTKAGWLHYFASKDAMLEDLLDELERRDTMALAPVVAAGKAGGAASGRRALATLLDMIIARFVACPELGRFAVVLSCEAIDPGHPAHDRFRSREATALAAYAALLAPSCGHPEGMARHLHALMTGLAQQWLRTAQGFDLLAAWHEASEKLLPDARTPVRGI
jgi:AcrR family transcriptional regulator